MKHTEWQSIEERSPEHEATVLITGHMGNNPKLGRYTAIAVYHKDGMFYDVDDGDDFYPPTHWMPLPPPPAKALGDQS